MCPQCHCPIVSMNLVKFGSNLRIPKKTCCARRSIGSRHRPLKITIYFDCSHKNRFDPIEWILIGKWQILVYYSNTEWVSFHVNENSNVRALMIRWPNLYLHRRVRIRSWSFNLQKSLHMYGPYVHCEQQNECRNFTRKFSNWFNVGHIEIRNILHLRMPNTKTIIIMMMVHCSMLYSERRTLFCPLFHLVC